MRIDGLGDEPRTIAIDEPRAPRGGVSRTAGIDVASRASAYDWRMALEQWPTSERPRERLYCNGADALADAELLALQLGSGRRGHNAVDVAREMLAAYGSLAGVASRELAELARLPGVGRAKAARLAAAFELTRRLRAGTPGRARALGAQPRSTPPSAR